METDNFWEIKKKLTFTEICVEVRRLGDDYHILVSGGECPHIGAPEVFTWTGSRKNRLRKLWKPCG